MGATSGYNIPMARTVLIIDDEENMRWVLKRALEKAGYEVLTARRGEEGLELFALHPVDLVLVDLKMPGMDGLAVLRELRQRDPRVPILLFTAYATVPTAVEALQWGATDYLRKPFDLETVLAKIHEAIARAGEQPNGAEAETAESLPATDFRAFVGAAPALQEALAKARAAAATDYTVHITGEPGTGRRLLGRLIHANHPSSRGRLVVLEADVLPLPLLRHEAMASSQEGDGPVGSWQQALGGSLLMADIQCIPPDLAGELVPHLERYRRTATRPHGLRLLLTSSGEPLDPVWHPLLEQAMVIALPPLRERLEDVPLLLAHFTPDISWDLAAREQLLRYEWPGNVAEFRRVVRQAAQSAQALGTNVVGLRHLPGHLQPPLAPGSGPFILPSEGIDLEAVEQDLLRQALTLARGNKSRAARLLGLTRATFLYRLDKYGIRSDELDPH